MTDSHAEQLDPSVLGEQVGDDERAAADYPPDEPLGVDDPSLLADGEVAPDDVATRETRLADPGHAGDATPTIGLVDPASTDTPSLTDDERQMVGDIAHADTGAEAAAIHVVDTDTPD